MMTCYLVFSEPDHVFSSVHPIIDGAAQEAAGLAAKR